MSKTSLLDICLDATSSLLIECFWPVGYYYSREASDEFNPFVVFPTHIIEELISRVIIKVPSGNLNIQHLYHLFSTGRVTNFIFEDVVLAAQDFIEVLAALSVHAFKLKKIILRQIFHFAKDAEFEEMKSRAIDCLLTMSPNLEHIEIDWPFDLTSLHSLRSLKHLDMNFVPKTTLFSLMPKIDDYTFVPHESLTHFNVFEDYSHRISVEEMAFLLQNCPQLVTIENNIAQALELLHGDELNCGLLTERYKLRNYTLGNSQVHRNDATVSATCVQIAAVTCPDTRQIDALVRDHQTLPVFADFKKLDSLLVQWEDILPGDYRLGLVFALRDIGSQLYELRIFNFKLLDFAEIGKFCPFLKIFHVEYDDKVNAGASSDGHFTRLEKLSIQCDGIEGIKSDVMLLLLANCVELRSLHLESVPHLTDSLLSNILEKNSLTQLKRLSLIDCQLSQQSLQALVTTCPLLESFHINTVALSLEEAAEAIHDVNPHIIVG